MAAGSSESFDELLERAAELLRRLGRISYRGLKRRLGVDDTLLEDLRAELVDARQLAVEESGKVLVWSTLDRATDALLPSDTQAVARDRDAHEGTLAKIAVTVDNAPAYAHHDVSSDPAALESERKQITVLLCDVVGSTGLLQRLDDEAKHEVMNLVLRTVGDAVHRFGGTISEYRGDGLMALFGAPRALEDHAVRAAYSALAIHEALAREPELEKLRPEVDIKLRVGLNSAVMIVGSIGPERRLDYTAVSEETNLAGRLEQAAQPGTTLISESTRRLIEGYVDVLDLSPIVAEGFREPVSAYQLLRPKPLRSRFEVMLARGLTPLVGRVETLAALRRVFEKASVGHGSVVSIVGDAGVGKSRIVHEFLHGLPRDAVTIAIGQCGDEVRTRPYVPILEWARALFGIEAQDSPRDIRAKVLHGTMDCDTRRDEVAAVFLEMLVPGGHEADVRHLDAVAWRRRMLEAVAAVAEASSKRRPVVLVLEDLHWIDPSSFSLLAALVRGMDRLPVLLVTTHRTGKATLPWADSAHSMQLDLDVFTIEEATCMMAALGGDREVPPELPLIVHRKTGGNALFVEEVMRGWLARQESTTAIAPGCDAASLDIPGTIDDILRARIDELEPPVKRVLQAAAAIGPQFNLRVLQLVEPRIDVTRSIESALRLGFIQPNRLYPEPEYAFKHAIVQEVVYGTLLKSRRRELNGRIGRAMETVHADRLDDHLTAIAFHFARSADWPKAFEFAVRAGEHAERLHARTEAMAHYEDALTAAQSMADGDEADRCRIDAMVKVAGVASTSEHLARDNTHLERAERLAEALADQRRIAQVTYRRGRLAYDRGDFVGALAFAERSLALAETTGDERLAAPPLNLVGRVHWNHGHYGRAAHLLMRSTDQMRRLGNRGEEATAAGLAGWTLAFLGEGDAALEFAERGLRLARELRNPFAESAARMYLGSVYDQRGEWSMAVGEYEAALALAIRAGDSFRQYLIKGQCGRAIAMNGDPSRGAAVLEEAIEFARLRKTTFVLSWMQSYLAECRLALGDIALAKRIGEDALRLAESTHDHHGSMSALRVLAKALARSLPPDFESAVGYLRQAIRIEHEMGVKPELGRTYAEMAGICRAMGRTAEARAYLSVARDIFEQQKMRFDLAVIERFDARTTEAAADEPLTS